MTAKEKESNLIIQSLLLRLYTVTCASIKNMLHFFS